jgi:hypothetical protein
MKSAQLAANRMLRPGVGRGAPRDCAKLFNDISLTGRTTWPPAIRLRYDYDMDTTGHNRGRPRWGGALLAGGVAEGRSGHPPDPQALMNRGVLKGKF